MSALWRSNRYAYGEYLKKLRTDGIEISSLLHSLGMNLKYACIGSLHGVDLGFSLDAICTVFWLLVSQRSHMFLESSIDKRVYAPWSRIKSMYATYKTLCRLQTLTREMIFKFKKDSTPKLNTKGGECRHIVPIVCEISAEHVKIDASVLHSTISAMFAKLLDYQMSLGITPFQHDPCAKACRDRCILYKNICETTPSNVWKMKPKQHLFQELCEHMTPLLGDPSNY